MTIAALFIISALSASQPPGAALQGIAARESQLAAEVAQRPTDFAPYQQLARIYSTTGRLEEAERVLRQALAVHQDSGAVFAALASLYSKPQDPQKLLAVAEEWTRVEPTNHQPLLVASRAHEELAVAAKANPSEARMHAERAKRSFEEATRLKGAQDAVTPPRANAQGGQLRWSTPPDAFPNAVRVGGNVRMPMKMKDVRPVMPPAALEARVQGVVVMEIVVNEAGAVAQAKVMRSIPLLDQAAIDAVRQWQFQPTEVEGRPVPIIMTVTVQFSLAQ